MAKLAMFVFLVLAVTYASAAPNNNCKWVKKDRGVIAGATDSIGQNIGGFFGGAFGAVAPPSANSGAIAAASGDESQDDSDRSGLGGVANTGGRLVGGTWAGVVPNSVRCGSITSAKQTGNAGNSRVDPACADGSWQDSRGRPCKP
ncbi:uncharacterized protein LOC129587151 [Paramacrobiotus metropolitanus]|uniref:uncharacterized protein LOC129587151 n=1 Tax=Paramacrobiotus metropolitanus TaxID=2943436 RepID=UPI002445DC7A|nr:uncharacterized protein LOC129587151 [Paramacrobiotus metropolitanus]